MSDWLNQPPLKCSRCFAIDGYHPSCVAERCTGFNYTAAEIEDLCVAARKLNQMRGAVRRMRHDLRRGAPVQWIHLTSVRQVTLNALNATAVRIGRL